MTGALPGTGPGGRGGSDARAGAALPALRFDQVVKEFPLGDGRVRALDGVTLDIAPGRSAAAAFR